MDSYLMDKVFINNGAIANLMHRLTFKKVGKTTKDLVPSNILVFNFNGMVLTLEGMV